MRSEDELVRIPIVGDFDCDAVNFAIEEAELTDEEGSTGEYPAFVSKVGETQDSFLRSGETIERLEEIADRLSDSLAEARSFVDFRMRLHSPSFTPRQQLLSLFSHEFGTFFMFVLIGGLIGAGATVLFQGLTQPNSRNDVRREMMNMRMDIDQKLNETNTHIRRLVEKTDFTRPKDLREQDRSP